MLNLAKKSWSSGARRHATQALTVIELVVVVAILSAVAAMVSRMGAGMVEKSAHAVGSASLMDLMRARRDIGQSTAPIPMDTIPFWRLRTPCTRAYRIVRGGN